MSGPTINAMQSDQRKVHNSERLVIVRHLSGDERHRFVRSKDLCKPQRIGVAADNDDKRNKHIRRRFNLPAYDSNYLQGSAKILYHNNVDKNKVYEFYATLAPEDQADFEELVLKRRAQRLAAAKPVLPKAALASTGAPEAAKAFNEKSASLLPAVAPALWRDRPRERVTNPAAFIQEHYAPWIGKGLSRADIKYYDFDLYQAYAKEVKRHPSRALDLPTRSERVDAELRQLAIATPLDAFQKVPSSRTDREAEKMAKRLYTAARNRQSR